MKPISSNHLDQVSRILVCQLRQIGDVLLCTPSLRLLRERFPKAEIHVYTESRSAALLEQNPCVNSIWRLDKHELSSFPKELAFYWRVARQDFDLVIDFQQLPRCRWVVAFSGARLRLSYPPPWYNRLLYTHWHPPMRGYAAMAKASILSPLGITWSGEAPELHLQETERGAAQEVLAALGLQPMEPLISVDPTHRRPSRAWPLEHWGRLLAMVAKKRPKARFLLHYGPAEQNDVVRVRDLAVEAGVPAERLLVPSEVLKLRQMAACIEQAALHLGTCSAPRHVAVALGVPSVIVLGATSWAWTFPSPEHAHIALTDLRPLECQPCNRNTCQLYDAPRCLHELTPQLAWPIVREHLERFVVSGS